MNYNKHAMSNFPEYQNWCTLISKARGGDHEVCYSWFKFVNFIRDMGRRPTNKHKLTRLDLQMGYCKENCYWGLAGERGGRTPQGKYMEVYRKRLTNKQEKDSIVV